MPRTAFTAAPGATLTRSGNLVAVRIGKDAIVEIANQRAARGDTGPDESGVRFCLVTNHRCSVGWDPGDGDRLGCDRGRRAVAYRNRDRDRPGVAPEVRQCSLRAGGIPTAAAQVQLPLILRDLPRRRIGDEHRQGDFFLDHNFSGVRRDEDLEFGRRFRCRLMCGLTRTRFRWNCHG